MVIGVNGDKIVITLKIRPIDDTLYDYEVIEDVEISRGEVGFTLKKGTLYTKQDLYLLNQNGEWVYEIENT